MGNVRIAWGARGSLRASRSSRLEVLFSIGPCPRERREPTGDREKPLKRINTDIVRVAAIHVNRRQAVLRAVQPKKSDSNHGRHETHGKRKPLSEHETYPKARGARWKAFSFRVFRGLNCFFQVHPCGSASIRGFVFVEETGNLEPNRGNAEAEAYDEVRIMGAG